MSQLRISSWNVEGRLSETKTIKRAKPNDIVKAIKSLNSDILVLLEAHSENTIDELATLGQLKDMGYYVYNAPYSDDLKTRPDAYTSQLSMVLLSKFKIDKFDIYKLGDIRNCFTATIDNKIRIIGVHLDDRSEENRIKQVTDLSKIINKSNIKTVVLGDLNTMHGEDIWPSKFLRSRPIRWLAQIILPIISTRAVEMARGEALKLLEVKTGLIDADINHRPTVTPKSRDLEWLPSIRLMQIDHIYISKNIGVSNFAIGKDKGSDHRAISATISF